MTTYRNTNRVAFDVPSTEGVLIYHYCALLTDGIDGTFQDVRYVYLTEQGKPVAYENHNMTVKPIDGVNLPVKIWSVDGHWVIEKRANETAWGVYYVENAQYFLWYRYATLISAIEGLKERVETIKLTTIDFLYKD